MPLVRPGTPQLGVRSSALGTGRSERQTPHAERRLATAVHRSGQDHGNPAFQGGEHVMSGLAVGFSPPHAAPERVTTRGWARDDVLPGIHAGVSSATNNILPTPMGCSR